MREIHEVFNVYTYDELSEAAKEKVRQWYLDDNSRSYEFEEMCNDDLHNLFHAKLKVEYSLSCCQGDGLNIYGSLDVEDIFDCLEKHNGGEQLKEFEDILTEKEKRTIIFYSTECGRVFLPQNRRYCYSFADSIDIAEDWGWTLMNECHFRNVNMEVLEKFEKLVRGIFSKLARDYEKWGYEYLYEVSEEEISEVCEANEWEFYEDGGFYVA